MTGSKIWDSIRMLVQRCTLEQHRLVMPVSVTKPTFESDGFHSRFGQSEYRALIDTGAQRTVLSRSLILQQNLMRTGHMQFAGLHGARTHTRYLASIGLWASREDSSSQSSFPDRSERTLFAIEPPIEAVDMDDNINFDLILGFDVLKHFSFSYETHDRTFTLIVQK